MIFYHFTGHRFLPSIREKGLQGLMVLDYGKLDRGVISLTTSDRPEGLGINMEDEPPTAEQREQQFLITGKRPPDDLIYWDKSAVRIRLKIASTDHRLIPWSKYMRRVEPVRLANMHRGENPSTWWMYRGVIPAERFDAIHYKHGTEYREEEPV
jgi:hypothetical protein